jgi:hypothetical protein
MTKAVSTNIGHPAHGVAINLALLLSLLSPDI